MISPTDIDFALKAITAAATTTIAVYVARITKRQWITNNEKLRLDLYNRRFDIYLRTLTFHQALIGWDGSEAQTALQAPFIKAFREAKFLFPEDSGVYQLLHTFFMHSFVIVKYSEHRAMFVPGSPEATSQIQKKLDAVSWIADSIGPLEDKLAPFLNFHEM
jgi:hypothetical protein